MRFYFIGVTILLHINFSLFFIFWKGESKFETGDAVLAVHDFDVAAVDENAVVDDGEAEARAAGFAGAPGVDAVEAVEEVGKVLRADADAIVT